MDGLWGPEEQVVIFATNLLENDVNLEESGAGDEEMDGPSEAAFETAVQPPPATKQLAEEGPQAQRNGKNTQGHAIRKRRCQNLNPTS